ncbi:MAG: AtpZ/AtpI family protein [Bryobacteraceae bacterium]
MPQTRPDGRNPLYVMVGRYMALAFLLPATTAVGYILGVLLDRALGTDFLHIVFLLLGIAAGLIKLIQELQKDTSGDAG